MPKPNASIVLNSRDRSSGSYNSCTFNARNQNIIQGQIHSIAVSEINFPYDIPNIQAGYNTFTLTPAVGFSTLTVTVPPGFYTGAELETAINDAITAAGLAASPPIATGNLPTVSFLTTANLFDFNAAASDTPNSVWAISSPVTLPWNGTGTVGAGQVGKDILSIMGFESSQNGTNIVDSDPVQGNSVFSAASAAPLLFTQYIDVCSAQLCKFQRFRDGSTTNLARRSDVICRLYIANNVATQEDEGTRPFIINRQFLNARVMKWTADNSVGTIDIQLYDDVGQPLTTTWQPRPYQITFNAYEINERAEAEGGDGLENLLKKYAAYQPRNEQAWASPSFPIRK